MTDALAGLYPALITSTQDPLGAFRFRVRVHGVHDPRTLDEDCPLAPVAGAVSSNGRGDYMPFTVGDTVLVAFLYGASDKPIIMGGLPRGLGDRFTFVPPDYARDIQSPDASRQSRAVRRWQRVDAAGNIFEMNEVGDEVHVLMRSGNAEVSVSSVGNTAVVRAAGQVIVQSSSAVRVEAGTISAKANVIEVETTGQDLTQLDDGRINIRGTRRVVIGAYDSITKNLGDVHIGGELPRFKDIPVPLSTPGSTPLQSMNCSMRAKFIGIGCAGGIPIEGSPSSPPAIPAVTDFETTLQGIPTGMPLLPTSSIYMRSLLSFDAATLGSMSHTSTLAMSFSAGGIMSLSAGGIMKIDAIGALMQTAGGPITITSTAAVNVEAPAINISAETLLKESAPAVTITALANISLAAPSISLAST